MVRSSLSICQLNSILKITSFCTRSRFFQSVVRFGSLFVVVLVVNYYYRLLDYAEKSSIVEQTIGNDTLVIPEVRRSTIGEELFDKIRIFCWIATWEKTEKRAIAVNQTWAPHCNKYVFVTPTKNSSLPSMNVNVGKGRVTLWEKTKRAFRRIYEEELQDYDFFLKADSDTYAQMENMRMMLAPYSPDDPLYFGCRFKLHVDQGYMSGGAGYLLSREALRRFVEEGLVNPQKCRLVGGSVEDLEMGRCMQGVGALAVDTRDKQHRHRMISINPKNHVKARNKNLRRFMYYDYPGHQSKNFSHMITFHYVEPKEIRELYEKYYPSPLLSYDEIGMIAANRRTGSPAVTLSNKTDIDPSAHTNSDPLIYQPV